MFEKTVTLEELESLLDVVPGDLIFLRGDLGAGKTAFVKAMAKKYQIAEDVKSPTYVYYRKYGDSFYHFDLYRIENYDTFVNVGGEEVLDDEKNLTFVEWPDVISDRYSPTVSIEIEKTDDSSKRKFRIERLRMPNAVKIPSIG